MSLLQKFFLLPLEHQQRIFQLYRTTGFPQEVDLFLVRQKCANWIEGNLWNNNINPDKREHEEKMKQWFISFSTQLQTCIHGASEPFKLNTALTYFQKHVQPRQLFRILKNCLNEELLTHSQMRSEKIVQLEKNIEQAEGLSRELQNVPNALLENETQMTTLIDWSTQDPSAASELEEMGRNCDRFISQKRLEYSGLERRINEIVGNLLQEAEQLLSNLTEAQQEPNHEQAFDGFLGNVLLLRKILQQTDRLITNAIQASHQPTTTTLVQHCHTVVQLITKITSLLKSLFVQSLSIVRHTYHIIKQDKKFDIDLCCLAPITLQFVDTFPIIKVVIINDREAANLHRSLSTGNSLELLPRSSGDVTFERCIHNFEEGQLTITMRNMKVPTRPIDPRNRPTPALRQKFYLFFYFTGIINDLPYIMWTLSNPFVYITNVSQVMEAACTIFWDTFLNEETDQFNIPDEVLVPTMTQALANYVQVETNAPWSLQESQRRYLAQKILQTNTYSAATTISRNQFENVRDPLTGVSFWEWFYATVKLIRENLTPFWAEGLIAGFMHRQQAEELLLYNKPGAFVLRCSDTCGVGGLSITWHEQGKGPCSLQPLTEKCLYIKNLTERIHDIDNFVDLLYPTGFSWSSKPKQEAFPYRPVPSTVPTEQFERVRAPGVPVPVKPYIRTRIIWSLFQGVHPRPEPAAAVQRK